MRDAIGNRLRVGQSVFLMSKQIIAKVVKIDEPSLTVVSRNGQKPQRPITVTLELTIPIMVPPNKSPQQETSVADLLTVIVPQESERADDIVDKVSEEVQ